MSRCKVITHRQKTFSPTLPSTVLTVRLGGMLSGSHLFQGWNESIKQKHPPSLGVRRFYAIVGSHLYYTIIYFYWKFKSNWKPWVFICLICRPSSCWMSVSSQLLCRTTWSACPHYSSPWLLFSSEQASLLTMNQPYLNRYPFCCTIFYSILSYFWYYNLLALFLPSLSSLQNLQYISLLSFKFKFMAFFL